MSDHGSDKTGPLRDEELKKELEGELRTGRSTRMEEEREPQPPGEDQPQADVAPGTALTGGTPPGMTPVDVELRSELARHLGRAPYPASGEEVLDALRRNHAPDRLVDLAARLPRDQRYGNVQDIARALGVEGHRT